MAGSQLIILALVLSISLALAGNSNVKSCYYGSGNQLDNSEFMPCGDSTQSSCCYVGSYCLADGACWDPKSQMTYIAGCTDENYQDPSCAAQSCTNKNSPIQGIAHACGGDDWYCCSGTGQQADAPQTTNNDTCPCDSANGEAVSGQSSLNPTASLPGDFNGQIAIFTTDSSGNSITSNINIPTEAPPTTSSGAPSSTTDSSTITSSAAASTTTSSGASTLTNNNNDHSASATPNGAPVSASPSTSPSSTSATTSTSNNAMKLGLGIGLPLAALALAGVITFAVLLFRRRRERRHADPYAYSGLGPGLGGDDRSTAVWQGDVSSHGATPAMAQKAYFGQSAYSDSTSPNPNVPPQGYTAYGGGHSRAESSTSNGYGGGNSGGHGHTPSGSVSAVSGPTSPPRGNMSELSSEHGWAPSHELGGSPLRREQYVR